MSSLSRHDTPELASSPSHSFCDEDSYQGPPSPQSDLTDYSLDHPSLFPHPYSGHELQDGRSSLPFDPCQDQGKIYAVAGQFDQFQDPRDFARYAWEADVGPDQIPYETLSAPGSWIVNNGLQVNQLEFAGSNGPVIDHLYYPDDLQFDPASQADCMNIPLSHSYFACDSEPMDLDLDNMAAAMESPPPPVLPSKVPITSLPPCRKTLPANFACSYCGQSFGRNGDCARHMKTSCRQRPFVGCVDKHVCVICGFKRERKDKVQKHCQTAHGQPKGQELFQLLAG